MKSLLIAALLLTGLGASAQLGFKTDRVLGNIIMADTTGERYRQLLNSIQPNALLLRGKFSHNTSKGKVYTLPYDNMPCLVPYMNQVSRMPQHNMPLGKMPNLVPNQQVVPGEDEEQKGDLKKE